VRVFRILVLLCLASGCVDLTRPTRLLDDGAIGDAHDARSDRPRGDGGTGEPMSDLDAADADDDAGDPGDDAMEADGPPDGPPEAAPLDDGRPCDNGGQCASGNCAQGVCCQSACADVCMACNLAGTAGTCTAVAAGEDPLQNCAADPPASCGLDGTCNGAGACRRYPIDSQCAAGMCSGATEYAASTCDGNGTCRPGLMRACVSGMCMGGSCASPCTKPTDCQSGFFCDAGKCALKRAAAAACTSAQQCGTGFCVDGVCCNSECGESCFACNLAGSVGSCKPVPLGQDPRKQCLAEAPTTCGRAGGCNGAGACRLHPANTICGPGSCAGTTETPARSCDGLGVCRPPGAPRDCNPYLCGLGACLTSCIDSSGCAPGFSCQSNVCARVPGLVLFWRFEEATGLTALDGSGNGHNGIYTGDVGTPAPSTDLPALMYANARSRLFTRSSRHAVKLQGSAAAVEPANDLTLSGWYRATRTDSGGSEIISGSNGYVLRLRPNGVEMSKRKSDSSYSQCLGNTPTFLDGRWHHVAAVASRITGLKLYYDGAEVCSMNAREDIAYPDGAGFFVGRHALDQDQWDFDGNLDEVRIYNRALSAAEVSVLAQGRNN
jgi:hypothetical protein